MSWRTVVISNRCKLDLSMNYMVVRGQDIKRVLLDEIAILILENNAVSITGCLLTALMEKKIKVVFCDNERNPQGELLPYYGCHNSSLKVRTQVHWKNEIRQEVWTRIVREKIKNQMIHLLERGFTDEAELLDSYIQEIMPGDTTNREAHAAKVYFNALFGMDFSRSDESNVINAALNYGYSLILSAVNREVSANGYLTQLGLAHENQFNPYNLSCDLMEPFRIIIDRRVREEEYVDFLSDEKHVLIAVLHSDVEINSTTQTLLNAIKIYVKSVFDAINNEDISMIKFPEI